MNYLFVLIYTLVMVPILVYFFQKYERQTTSDDYNKKMTILIVFMALTGIFIFKKTEIMTIEKFLKIIRYNCIFWGILAGLYSKYKKNKDKTDKLIEKYYLVVIVPILIGTTIIGKIIK